MEITMTSDYSKDKTKTVYIFPKELIKRFFELILSTMILFVTLPIMAIVALAVKLDSPGPVFFRHVRVGINRRKHLNPISNEPGYRQDNRFGRPFTLYKFRTMYVDARERFPDLYKYDYSEEQLSSLPMKALLGSEPGSNDNKLGNDPRVTRIGSFLRRTSLDELPNFINVIKGDMSLVGPRPDISDNVPNYKLEHMEKFNVKPGITGLAQVMGRGTLSFHRTNELDIEYIKNHSLWLDVKILLNTILVSIKGIGSY